MVADYRGVYRGQETGASVHIRVERRTFRAETAAPKAVPPPIPLRRKDPYVSLVSYGDSHDEPQLISPIVRSEVFYSDEDECWIASDGVSLEYGVGDTPEEAVSDFVDNLHEMASWFRDNTRELSPFMLRRRRIFERLFQGL